MKTRTIRQLRVLVPELDSELDVADPPAAPGGTVADVHVTGEAWRGIHLTDTTVVGSWFDAADLAETVWQRCTVVGSEIHNTDLTGAEIADTTLDRCLVRGCRITGARLVGLTLKNTIFENCRLDYSVIDQARCAGPVALVGCTLVEATLTACQFAAAVIADCRLRATTLDRCDLRGADVVWLDATCDPATLVTTAEAQIRHLLPDHDEGDSQGVDATTAVGADHLRRLARRAVPGPVLDVHSGQRHTPTT